MLMFLCNSTRIDTQFSVHQCARFSANPKMYDEQWVKRACKCLFGTTNKVLVMNPDQSWAIECFADANFSGGYIQGNSEDSLSVLSCTGVFIMYECCPIVCVSKLQTEIMLSTTEKNNISISKVMRDLVPFISRTHEMVFIFSSENKLPQVLVLLFGGTSHDIEDSNRALALETAPLICLCMKHISLRYHHFRLHVTKVRVKILQIGSRGQAVNKFIKPLDPHIFQNICFKLCGW